MRIKDSTPKWNSWRSVYSFCFSLLFCFVLFLCILALYWYYVFYFEFDFDWNSIVYSIDFIGIMWFLFCPLFVRVLYCHRNSNFQKNLFDDIYNSQLCYSEQLTHSIDHCEVSAFFFFEFTYFIQLLASRLFVVTNTTETKTSNFLSFLFWNCSAWYFLGGNLFSKDPIAQFVFMFIYLLNYDILKYVYCKVLMSISR